MGFGWPSLRCLRRQSVHDVVEVAWNIDRTILAGGDAGGEKWRLRLPIYGEANGKAIRDDGSLARANFDGEHALSCDFRDDQAAIRRERDPFRSVQSIDHNVFCASSGVDS